MRFLRTFAAALVSIGFLSGYYSTIQAAEPSEAIIVCEKGTSAGGVDTLKIADSKSLAELDAFFPDYKTRPNSGAFRGPESDYKVYFTFPDGKSIRLAVTAADRGAVWSMGHGTYDVRGNFPEFVERLAHDKLIGAWECISENTTNKIVKTISDKNFSCVHYDRNSKEPKVSIGGTWTLRGDVYKEHVDYATEGHKHLRGRDFTFHVKIDDDTWIIKAAKGTGINVDEVWKRVK